MMMKQSLMMGLALLLTGLSQGLHAEQNVEQRLQQLERLLNSNSLMEMAQRLDIQEREIQQLRGRVEEQENTIEGLRNRQRELYLDTDRRLSRIEREGTGAMLAPSTPATAGDSSGAAANSPAPLAAPAGPAAPVMDEARMQQERDAYQKAFDLLRELRYEQATTAFRDFLKEYPDGRYAHIAQYWLGEASYAQRKFDEAIQDYQDLIDKFPGSPKRAEAMLKIGYSWNALKQPAKARPVLQGLVDEFPNSTEAGQARNLLQQLP
ncbi:MAG: tol-pal system protein YbgF [Gammaproteobacteria bacterium]|nr:tol-pal system protein YbgF [Gammaproteobacteria bacterium]